MYSVESQSSMHPGFLLFDQEAQFHIFKQCLPAVLIFLVTASCFCNAHATFLETWS